MLSTSKDYDEIKEIEWSIISAAEEAANLNYCKVENGDIVVGYDDAVRVYTDYTLFEDREVSAARVNEIIDCCIENTNFGWQVPVYSKDVTIGVLVFRQMPLREEVKSNLSEEEQQIIFVIQ